MENNIDLINQDLKKNQNKLKDKNIENCCLIIKKANTWIEEAKKRPIPNMLFSEFWYEHEVCIFFSDTNLGKSVLAVQIADSISKGIAIPGFKLECSAQIVLYLDFELSDKQFENRCSVDYNDHYIFSPNFLRAEINSDLELPAGFKSLEDYLCNSLSNTIETTKATVLIVDNITFLSNENEKAKDALTLMKTLKKLSRKKNISILVLSHSPKRDESKLISKNDLSGSKMLMNFCDSSFAIGSSSEDPSYRYIKQIKQRHTEHIYHSENVVVCCVDKKINFLQLHFLEFGSEREHLKIKNSSDLDERDIQMKDLISKGMSNTNIAKNLSVSEGAIRKRRIKLGL